MFYFFLMLGFCAFFFDSRIMQLLLLCCPLAGLVVYWKGYRNWAAMLVAFLCCFYVNVTLYGDQKKDAFEAIVFGFKSLSQSANVIDPMVNDIDRMLQVSAALEASASHRNILGRVLGTGFYTHRYEIGYWVEQKYAEALPGFSEASLAGDFGGGSRPIFRTTALAGYIIDTGILGIALISMVLFSVVYFALGTGVREFLAGGICTSLALAWTYSNFSLENALWFLLMFIVAGLCRQSGSVTPSNLSSS